MKSSKTFVKVLLGSGMLSFCLSCSEEATQGLANFNDAMETRVSICCDAGMGTPYGYIADAVAYLTSGSNISVTTTNIKDAGVVILASENICNLITDKALYLKNECEKMEEGAVKSLLNAKSLYKKATTSNENLAKKKITLYSDVQTKELSYILANIILGEDVEIEFKSFECLEDAKASYVSKGLNLLVWIQSEGLKKALQEFKEKHVDQKE